VGKFRKEVQQIGGVRGQADGVPDKADLVQSLIEHIVPVRILQADQGVFSRLEVIELEKGEAVPCIGDIERRTLVDGGVRIGTVDFIEHDRNERIGPAVVSILYGSREGKGIQVIPCGEDIT